MQRRNLVILCNLELHGIKRILRGILVLERRPNMVRVSVVLINLCRLVCCVVFLIYRRRKLEPVLRLLIHYTAILVMNFHVGLDRITVLAVQANKNNGFVLAIISAFCSEYLTSIESGLFIMLAHTRPKLSLLLSSTRSTIALVPSGFLTNVIPS